MEPGVQSEPIFPKPLLRPSAKGLLSTLEQSLMPPLSLQCLQLPSWDQMASPQGQALVMDSQEEDLRAMHLCGLASEAVRPKAPFIQRQHLASPALRVLEPRHALHAVRRPLRQATLRIHLILRTFLRCPGRPSPSPPCNRAKLRPAEESGALSKAADLQRFKAIQAKRRSIKSIIKSIWIYLAPEAHLGHGKPATRRPRARQWAARG